VVQAGIAARLAIDVGIAEGFRLGHHLAVQLQVTG